MFPDAIILSKIERDENWKIADYYPTGFSLLETRIIGKVSTIVAFFVDFA